MTIRQTEWPTSRGRPKLKWLEQGLKGIRAKIGHRDILDQAKGHPGP